MIDPKLNELPVEPGSSNAQPANTGAQTRRPPRQGLSINDTIAGDTLTSVGSRGVDTSGVEAGAGAGSGTTVVTPTAGTSPAPDIIPGARATGTTPRATSASGRSPAGTAHSDYDTPAITGDSNASHHRDTESFSDDEVASRAYECWCERGCPDGTPEVDWHRAVDDIRERRRLQNRTSAARA